jgi:hypothetical protein
MTQASTEPVAKHAESWPICLAAIANSWSKECGMAQVTEPVGELLISNAQQSDGEGGNSPK